MRKGASTDVSGDTKPGTSPDTGTATSADPSGDTPGDLQEWPSAHELNMLACPACKLVCEAAFERTSELVSDAASERTSEAVSQTLLDSNVDPACPRCGASLHRRKPESLSRAWAFLIAAMVFYVPANLYPVVYTDLLGKSAENTIAGGILDFWHTGSHALALLIFVASVGVPCGKFLALSLLLVTSQRASKWAMVERTRLYRMLELVGYWSMLDVLVVAWGSALGNFGVLSAAGPRIGILFFGLVVIFTLLSAISFDPRLIWDSKEHA